jgi:predicted flap endonuclease-1-like 5' DNA nuclease
MLKIANASFSNRILPFLADAQSGGVPWWVWLLLIVVVVLLLWWWFKLRPKKEDAPTKVEPLAVKSVSPSAPADVRVAPVAPVAPDPIPPDDLTVIEGIGPKIASLLQSAGITTFAQLAEADVARVSGILKDAEFRLADPSTWGEQAQLAAEGRWDQLKSLQNNLKGGRQV